MRKKITALLMAVLMVLSFAACGKTIEATDAIQIESSVALLDSIWTTYGEEEKYPVMGGDFSAPVDGAAGAFNLTDKENAVATLHIADYVQGKCFEVARCEFVYY